MHTIQKNPVIAHRGAFKKNVFPENSIAALKEAIRLQCAGSEFDVHMTADDTLVINHDPHFHKLEIEKVSYKELRRFALSNGEPLPTLRQYLGAGMENNTSTKLVLEIKPSGISKERGIKITEKCVAMVEAFNLEKNIVYISFDYDMLKHIRQLKPESVTQYLNGDISPEQLKNDGIAGADYHFSVFKKYPEWIKSAKEKKLVLNAWTVNTKEDMVWLLQNGFDYITTNEPELLLEVVKDLQSRKR